MFAEIFTQIALSFTTALATAAVAASGVVFLAKTWMSERIKSSIKSEYDQKLETHKAELKAKSDVELERLRSQLNTVTVEHEIRFSRLHEKRADAIAQTYSDLAELYDNLKDYVRLSGYVGEPSKTERFQKIVKAQNKFYATYSPNRIFFPKPIADALTGINRQCMDAATDFQRSVSDNPTTNEMKTWNTIATHVKNDIQRELINLENEFRILLGEKGNQKLN